MLLEFRFEISMQNTGPCAERDLSFCATNLTLSGGVALALIIRTFEYLAQVDFESLAKAPDFLVADEISLFLAEECNFLRIGVQI